VPDDGQLARVPQISRYRLGVHGVCANCAHATEAQEVKDKGVDDFEWEGIFLLEQCLDEYVARPCGIGIRRHLLGCDLTQAVQCSGRVKDWDRDFGDNGGDNDGFTLRACAIGEHGEHDALEEGTGLVQGLLERIVQVHIQLVCFLDVVLYGWEEDGVEEDLCCLWFS
jgi:hypothetical protein